jgi:hypothetical protein
MKRSKPGRSVTFSVSIWRGRNGQIHLVSKDKGVKKFSVAVREDATKRSGHPALFGKLDKLLSNPE